MKKMILAIVLGLTFLFGCEETNKRGKDGYYFEKESFIRTEIEVNVVLLKTQEEMEAALEEVGGKVARGRKVAAFATLDVKEPRCTIYIVDPNIDYQPEFIGHEFTHCVFGEWHKVQP